MNIRVSISHDYISNSYLQFLLLRFWVAQRTEIVWKKKLLWLIDSQTACFSKHKSSHLVGCEECPQSAPQLCLPGSISWVCIWAASWTRGLCPSAGGGRPAGSTCTSRRVSPAAADPQPRRPPSRTPAWSGPPCKCSCTRPQTRSWWSWTRGPDQSRCFHLQHIYIYSGLCTDLRSHRIFLSDSSQPMTWLKAQLFFLFFFFFLHCWTTFFTSLVCLRRHKGVPHHFFSSEGSSGSYC